MAPALPDTALSISSKNASYIESSLPFLDRPHPSSNPNSSATKSEQHDLTSFDDSGYVSDPHTPGRACLESFTPPENATQVCAPTADVSTLREAIRPSFDISCFRIGPGGIQLCLVRVQSRKRAAIERNDTQDFPSFTRLDPFLQGEVAKWYLESINPTLEGDWSNTIFFLPDREMPHIFRINTAIRDEASRIGSKFLRVLPQHQDLKNKREDLECDTSGTGRGGIHSGFSASLDGSTSTRSSFNRACPIHAMLS